MKKAISIILTVGLAVGIAGSAMGENRLISAAGITQGTADSLYGSLAAEAGWGGTQDFTGGTLLAAVASAANEVMTQGAGDTRYAQLAAANTFTKVNLFPDGTGGAPSIAFASETGTGMFLTKAGRIAWEIDGTGTVLTLDASSLGVDFDFTVDGSTTLGDAVEDGLTIASKTVTYTSVSDVNFNFASDVLFDGASLVRFESGMQFDGTKGSFEIEGSGGIDMAPGVGVDTDLIEVSVAGTPELRWLTATEEFELTKGLRVPEIGMGTTPKASTLFHLASTTQTSIPMPAMTSTQRDAISGPGEAEWVFDTTNNVPNFHNGTGFRAVLHVAASSLTTTCVPFADSAHSLNDDAGLTWDNTGKILAAKNVTLDGRLQGDKGGDVASADEITLGTDGNYFDITGTTTINHITKTGWQAGAVVILQFDASVTVTDNAGSPAGTEADILLEGAGDFEATADDTLQLVYDGTTFREVSRTVI